MATDIEKKYSEWIGKAREYAVIGEGRALILLADSLDILLGTAVRADAVITDPPYEFDAAGGPRLFGREKSSFNDMRIRGLAEGFDMNILESASLAPSMAVFFHNDQLFKIVGALTEPRRVSVPYDEENGQYYTDTLDPLYSRFALCGWNKTNPMPVANKHYMPDTELYIHAWRAPAFPQGELTDKRRFISEGVGKSEHDHPTVKPQAIMRKVVTNASAIGDIVLDPFMGSGSTGVAALALGRRFIGIEIDPFMGSGSTGVAALALGRRFIGIEIDPKFFAIAKERLAGIAGEWLPSQNAQPTLFGG